MAVQPGRRRQPRQHLAVSVCVLFVALVAVGGLGGVAAAEDGEIESVSVDDNVSFAGVTETHTVTVETTNATGDEQVEIAFEAWAGNVTDVDADTGSVDGPTDGVVTAELDDDGEVILGVELTHPTAADGYDIDATLVEESGATIDGEGQSATIDVQGVGLEVTGGEAAAVGSNDEQTAAVEFGLGDDFGDAHGETLVVSSPDLSDDDLAEILAPDDADGEVTRTDERILVTPGEYEASFRDFDGATYRIEATPVASTVFTAGEVDVVEPQIDGAFDSDHYEVPAGDSVTVEIDLEELDGAYLLVGADHKESDQRPRNFLDIVYVEADSLTVNTRLLGTDVDGDEVYRTEGPNAELASYLHDGPDGDGTSLEQRLAEVRFEDANGRTTYEDLTAFREALGMTPQPRPIQPERYRFVLGADGTVEERNDGIADFREPIARSNLRLTQPEVESVRTFVAPRGPANDIGEPGVDDLEEHFEELSAVLTEREAVAKEDRLVIEVNATGIYGALHYLDGETEPEFEDGVHPRNAQQLLDHHEGVVLEAIQRELSANEIPAELDLGGATDGQAFVVPEPVDEDDPVRERFYLVVDTRDSGAFDGGFRAGEATDFEFEYGHESVDDERYRFDSGGLADRPAPFDPASEPADDGTEQFPYLGRAATDESVTAPFRVEESFAEYDQTTPDGAVALTNGTNVTLTGETNVAPDSEFYIQVVADNRSTPTRITIDDVNVSTDGRFRATRDLSALRTGEGVEVEFYAEDRIVDKRGGEVLETQTLPSRFEVAELPDRTVVEEGEAATIAATIENAGTEDGTGRITLEVDGEERNAITRAIEGGANLTAEFDVGVFEPGSYEYRLVTPDDEASGTLAVGEEAAAESDEEDDESDEDAVDDSIEEDDGDADETEDAGEEEADDDDGLPEDLPDGLFGLLGSMAGLVGTEHAVGGAALVGGIHVLGHWL